MKTKVKKGNCAFQYYREGEPIIDECELTLKEAKQLFNDNYKNMVSAVRDFDLSIEVAIWINMKDKYSYNQKELHICDPIVKNGYLYCEYMPFNIK